MTEPARLRVGSVRERLDQALVEYLDEFQIEDIADINVEQVARLAGVSRATAYRHFGDQNGLLFEAAMKLTRHHAAVSASRVAGATTAAESIERAFAYTAYAVRTDRLLRMLMTSRRSPAIDAAIRELGLDILGPAIRGGQRDGQVRADLSVAEILDWVSEMQFVVIRVGLDEDAVLGWVRKYMLPTLANASPSETLLAQVDAIVTDLQKKLKVLGGALAAAHETIAAQRPVTAWSSRQSKKR
jgi:AcrR family transcriptional regulator